MLTTIYAPALRLDRPELPPKRPERELQSPKIPPFFDRWGQHPGEGLVPSRLVSIYRTAEMGYPAEQCDMFDDIIESDAHLRSQLETRVDCVAGKEWIVQAGGDDKEDERAADLLDGALKLVPNFADMIEHQLTAQWYGWSATEIDWDLTAGGVLAPVWFANVPHRRFVFDAYDDPHLLTRSSMIAQGVPLEPGAWLFTKRRHRVTAMSGLMRTAAWWALWKRMSIRDWVAFAARFGIPMPIGTYRDDMPEAEKDAVRRAVEMIGKEGYAVFSEAGKIEFARPDYGGAAGEVHPSLATFCNAEISKLITGGTLTSGEGTSSGSYALGKVHENVAFNIVLSDAKRLGDTFAQQVGAPFCRFNRITARPPRLRINVVREIDPAARMDIFCRAANELGLKLDADQVRQEQQIKAPVGEALVGVETLPPPVPPGGAAQAHSLWYDAGFRAAQALAKVGP